MKNALNTFRASMTMKIELNEVSAKYQLL